MPRDEPVRRAATLTRGRVFGNGSRAGNLCGVDDINGTGCGDNWFAALLRVICFVDDADQEDLLQDEVVHVFRATDRDAAFLRALELGHGQEHQYLNHEGAVVQWRFDRVSLKLQHFSTEDLDGAEVSSQLSRQGVLAV